MGQYYIIANVDKKEFLHPHNYGCGMKLTEWSYQGNHLVNAMLNLMKNRWKGDRVFVVGDYADLKDYDGDSKNWHDTYADLVKEFGLFDGDYEGHPDAYSLFSFAECMFKHLSKSKTGAKKTSARYLYNHATKQIVDISECPKNNYDYTFSPISLLLAMGNGRGGGDYHEHLPSYGLIGAWVSTSQHIEVADKPLDGCDDYEKFAPGFIENF